MINAKMTFWQYGKKDQVLEPLEIEAIMNFYLICPQKYAFLSI